MKQTTMKTGQFATLALVALLAACGGTTTEPTSAPANNDASAAATAIGQSNVLFSAIGSPKPEIEDFE